MDDYNFRSLLDETNQLIQISNISTYEVLYANKPAATVEGEGTGSYQGRACYEYMMGLDRPCDFCPLQHMSEDEDGSIMEVDNGDQVYEVKVLRLNWEGHDAFVEYVSDITAVDRARKIYRHELETLLDSIPNDGGIFRMNLTRNSCDAVGEEDEDDGAAGVRHPVGTGQTADGLIHSIAGNIAGEKDKQKFISVFCAEALLAAYEHGKTEVHCEAGFYQADNEVRWNQMTARIMTNPDTGDRECILYGIQTGNRKDLQPDPDSIEELLQKESCTGLYTKSTFENLCKEYLISGHSENFALIFLDVDHLRKVNNTFGHLVGDLVIADVARKIQVHFSNLDLIARYGGDEFTILLKDVTMPTLHDKLEWLLKKVRANYEGMEVTASIGAVYCDNRTKDYYKLMTRANQAVDEVKRCGRNSFRIVDFREEEGAGTFREKCE